MAKLSLKTGTTSKLVTVFVADSSSTTGAGLTGLVFNTSSLTAYYYREGAGSATAISLATMTLGTWATGGFVVVDATNCPGLYSLGIPDAALAAGAKSVVIMLKGATNMAPCLLEIELTAWDNQDAVHGGMSALPNAAAEAAGGLYTRGTGAGQIRQDANGRIDANTKAWIDGTIPAVNVTGVPKVDVADWLGTAPATPNTNGVPVVDTRTILRTNTAQATGNSTTAIKLDSGASATDSYYKGCLCMVISGTGSPEFGMVTAYVGSTKIATVSPAWPTAPDSTSVFMLVPGAADVETWLAGAIPAVNVTGVPKVDLVDWLGAAPSALNSGLVQGDVERWLNGAIPAVNVTGVPKVDVVDWLGTAVTAATAGVPDVNTKNYNNTAAQTDANNLPKVDTEDWKGTAAATANTAGVPVVDQRGGLIRTGTAQATGNSTTAIKLDSGASATDGYYKGCRCVVLSGTGSPEFGMVTAYVGSTKIATISPAWPTAPDSTSVFVLLAGMTDIESWGEAAVNALVSGRVDASLGANNAGNLTANLIQVNAHAVTDTASGVLDVNAKNLGGTAQTGRDLGASVLLSSGTGTGQVSLASGAVTVGTNNDKTGYTASTVSDKTGYALTSGEHTSITNDVWDAARSGHVAAGSFGLAAQTVIRDNTAAAGAASTITLDASASTTADIYKGCVIYLYAGTGSGQAPRLITTYSTGRVATVSPAWTTTPDNTSKFLVFADVTSALVGSDNRVMVSADTHTSGETVAAVTGAVGSVTGAVGSVTGNVSGTLANLASGAKTDVENVVWNSARSSHTTAGSFGEGAASVQGNVTGSVGSVTGAVGSVTGAVGSVTAAVTVGTNNDKSGYGLSTLESLVQQSGTAQAGAAGTITLASAASATDSLYVGAVVKIYSGTGAGQARSITAYNGTTKVATVGRNWTTNPDSTSVYAVLALSVPKVDDNLQVVAASVNGNVTGSVGSVTGAVGSVTGNVGGNVVGSVASVTGNVGGNVVGSVASVTGAVGSVTGNVGGTLANLAAGAKTDVENSVWDATRSSHVAAGSFGLGLTNAIRDNTATAGAASTITLDAGAPTTADIFKGAVIYLYAGTGSGQAPRLITAYSTGRVATVSPAWTTQPDNTSKFVIFAGTTAPLVGSDNRALVSADAHTAGETVAAVSGAVGSVTAGVTVSTNNDKGGYTASTVSDKTGYALTTGEHTNVANDVWDAARSGHTASGTFGQGVASVQGAVTGAVASVTGNVGGNVVGSVASVTAAVTTTLALKKNTALSNFEFAMFDATDHVTPKTGLTITGTVSLDGAAFAALTNSAAEIGTTGIYKINLAAADLNANVVTLKFTASGADATLIGIVTQS